MELLKVARVPATLASPEISVFDAAVLMAEREVGAVVIVNTQNQALGIFTERDNLLKVTVAGRDPKGVKLRDVMSSPLVTAPPNMEVQEALTLMVQRHFRHLPIVDDDNRVIGITSLRYLLMRRLGEKEANLEVLSAYISAGGPG